MCQEEATHVLPGKSSVEVLLGSPGFYHLVGLFFLAVGFLGSSDRLKRSVNPHCRAGVYFPRLLGPQDTYFQNPRHDSGSLAYRMKPKTRHLWATCGPVPAKPPSPGCLSQAYTCRRAHTPPLHNNCSGLRGSPHAHGSTWWFTLPSLPREPIPPATWKTCPHPWRFSLDAPHP